MTTDETLVRQFQPEMKSELWKGSLPYKKAKTVMSAAKVMVYILKDAKGKLLLYYLERVTLLPGLPLTRKVLFNQNIAFAHTSIVSKHGYLVYSSLLNTIVDEAINDVDHFLMAQNSAFYIENMHLLLDQWSKCVYEGGDCVVIQKIIVLFSKTDTNCSWSIFQEE